MVVYLLRYGIPFLTGYAGGWAGMLAVALLVARPAAERMQTERPGETVCGNMFVGPLLFGLAVGVAGGFWAGRRICHRCWPATRLSPDPTGAAPDRG